jgi:hypothetical protein
VKTSENESLMTYRNRSMLMSEPGACTISGISAVAKPIRWLRGIRYIGDVSAHQAFMRNLRTCRCDAKGECRVSGPHKAESTNAWHRGGATRSSGDDS